MKKAAKFRDSTDAELQQQLLDATSEYFNLKVQQTMGQLEKSSRLVQLRRNIARLKTVQRERQLVKG